jgi:hypothetical protein
LPTRIERTVAHRATLFEDVSPVRRALACRAASSPAVGRALAAADTLLYEDIKATFDLELAALSSSTRAEHVAAMDTCTSWEAWERLRATSGMPVRGARRVMSLVLTALTAGPISAADPRTPTAS